MFAKDPHLIASVLVDIYSWESDNLEKDFADYIVTICPMIPRGDLLKLFDAFDRLDPVERDSVTFPLLDFVESHLSK